MMFAPTQHQMRAIKIMLFLAALLPAGRLVWGVWQDALGANPLEFITRNSGDWTLYFLCATLCITPLRRLLNWNWLIKLRRMLGLYVFFYACVHFSAFFWFDHFFAIDEMIKDVFKRPFILVGMLALLGLIPLALTSTNGMIRRLGGKNWQRLHQLVYGVALLGVLHYWWMKAGKQDFTQPLIFAIIVGVLLALRVYWKFWPAKGGAAVPS